MVLILVLHMVVISAFFSGQMKEKLNIYVNMMAGRYISRIWMMYYSISVTEITDKTLSVPVAAGFMHI